MRRKVDLRQIISNIHLVRSAALRLAHKAPRFHFLCGLYDQNSLNVDDLARLAISLDIQHVAFWNLTPYPPDNTDVPKGDWIRPLDDLDDDALRSRLAVIFSSFELLRRFGISVSVQGNFVETLAKRVKLFDERKRVVGSLKGPATWYDPGVS
jgi:hypothetical protein